MWPSNGLKWMKLTQGQCPYNRTNVYRGSPKSVKAFYKDLVYVKSVISPLVRWSLI